MAVQSEFKTGSYVVYPAHGVGKVDNIEQQDVAGSKLDLLVITFDKDRMTIRIPFAKAPSIGLRMLSSKDTMDKALKTLKTRRRVARTMWSRRAQEYETKIHSGDPISLAEVIRDLHRKSGPLEQAYSERQIYQAALERLSREIAAIEQIDELDAVNKVKQALQVAPAA